MKLAEMCLKLQDFVSFYCDIIDIILNQQTHRAVWKHWPISCNCLATRPCNQKHTEYPPYQKQWLCPPYQACAHEVLWWVHPHGLLLFLLHEVLHVHVQGAPGHRSWSPAETWCRWRACGSDDRQSRHPMEPGVDKNKQTEVISFKDLFFILRVIWSSTH